MTHSRLGYLIAAALLLAAMPAAASARNAVLLECFTSEGCSSCPPADDLLAELDRAARAGNAEVFVLGEHVDYWNRLGWMDSFSSAGFSDRQERYASRFGNRGVYTPQVVVDGRAELVGSDRFHFLRAVVRRLTELGTLNAATPSVHHRIKVRLDPGWAPANLKAVVFLQERGAGRVLGAASARLFP